MDERRRIAEQRAIIYEWLSGLFEEALPTSRINSYQSGSGAHLLAVLAEDARLRHGVDRMRAALSPDVPADDIARGLERTFTALFLGAGGPDSLPPYESAHVSHSGLLFQEATGEMQQLLSRLGMSVERRCKEPPDHLAIEVATLAQLLRLRAKSDSSALDGTAAAFVRRLFAWVSTFSQRCTALDPTGFYAGASMLLLAFLDQEHGQHTEAMASL